MHFTNYNVCFGKPDLTKTKVVIVVVVVVVVVKGDPLLHFSVKKQDSIGYTVISTA